MAQLLLTRRHALGLAEARKRAERLITTLGAAQGLVGAWRGDVFEISKPASGKLTLTETGLSITLELNFVQNLARGVIEAKINEELARALA